MQGVTYLVLEVAYWLGQQLKVKTVKSLGTTAPVDQKRERICVRHIDSLYLTII